MSLRLALASFRPRLIDSLAGYDRIRFFKDLGAGATVGIVALPLAMAFAIASGLPPQAGIWTAIVAGGLISLLGGSAVQIGGPAGAFIVIVYGIVERYGVPNLLIATASAGVLLFLLGLFKLGTLVRYVPVSIVVGFTNGIAALILISQLKDFLGLDIERMPADMFSQLQVLGLHLGRFNAYALGLGVACVAGLAAWPHLTHEHTRLGTAVQAALGRVRLGGAMRAGGRVPAPIVALVSLTLLSFGLGLPVDTIGSRFGGIPQSLPAFALPGFSWETVKQLVTPTVTIALLGAIESLLCARVADQASGLQRHDPNQELMAQGLANLVVPFIGGMPATGTIARTVTNVRAGATSPVAGVVHSLTLLLVVLAAAPLAQHVPLSVLAGILLYVGWNMGEWREFSPSRLRCFSRHYRLLMLGTFLLTVVFDLTVAVEVGMVLACALFIRRMSGLFRMELVSLEPPVMTWRLHGALFFGATAKVDEALGAIEQAPRGMKVVLDATHLLSVDATGIDALRQLHKGLQARGGCMQVEKLQSQPAEAFERSGLMAEILDGQQAWKAADGATAKAHLGEVDLATPSSPEAEAANEARIA